MKKKQPPPKKTIPDWLYKIWPLLPIVIALGFIFFTSWNRTLPSLLIAYALSIIGIRLFNKPA